MTGMTVSELEQWARHQVEELEKSLISAAWASESCPGRMLDLIADWKEMREQLQNLICSSLVRFRGAKEVSDALQRLRLKP